MNRYQIYIMAAVLTAAVMAIILIIVFLNRKRKTRPLFIDDMDGDEFEEFCAQILEAGGFSDVSVTKASRDYGADILAEKDGVTYAIQCKCYADPVGVKAIQEAYAARDFYDRMVGAVMTNRYFTQPAVEAAKKLKILLWDRGYIEEMLEEDI